MNIKTISSLCLLLVLLNSSAIYATDNQLEEPFFTLTFIGNPNQPTAELKQITTEMIYKPELIVNRMVEIQQAVIAKLNCEGVFPEIADVFDGKSMNFYIETAADFGDGPLNYIRDWCEGFSVNPYSGAQHWGLPFNDAIKTLAGMKETGVKGLLEMITNKKISEIPLNWESLDDWEDLFDEDELLGGLSFLKSSTQAAEEPFKLPG
jgi:hypothetical protein